MLTFIKNLDIQHNETDNIRGAVVALAEGCVADPGAIEELRSDLRRILVEGRGK